MQTPSLAGRPLADYYHVCAFFDSREEEYDVLTPFFAEGIDAGEKIVNIVDPALIDSHLAALQGRGIDTAGCQACGQLEVLSWDDVYLNGGRFDQDQMLDVIDGALEAGREAGYPRMRIMGNMGWTLYGKPGTEEVVEFEARVNDVLSRRKQIAVCVYDMARMNASLMMDILRSHPLTLVNNIVHENPFYTPPALLLQELRTRRGAAPPRSPAAQPGA